MGTGLDGLVLSEWLQDGVKNVNKLPFLLLLSFTIFQKPTPNCWQAHGPVTVKGFSHTNFFVLLPSSICLTFKKELHAFWIGSGVIMTRIWTLDE
jgi:hypothetical protein